MPRARRHFIPGCIWHQSSLFKLPSSLYRASPDKSPDKSSDRYNASGFAFGFDPTGRCHKKEFLLKFAKDRRRWMHWLFEAKKRYGLSVLNYMIKEGTLWLD
jgi:hypothetical protein